jgi:DsbC/DsbD-like thiol-disulfide interchange protein
MRIPRVWMALTALIATSGAAGAQMVRPKADVATVVEHEQIRAGGPARVVLQVSLPETFHVQSNKPRDPTLIPTELKIDTPAGITVDEVVFPPSTDLKQAGSEQPLAVFERTFDIGVRLAVASTVAPGDVTVPLHLRYQACDAAVCYPPATADAVVAPRRAGRSANRSRSAPRALRPDRLRAR